MRSIGKLRVIWRGSHNQFVWIYWRGKRLAYWGPTVDKRWHLCITAGSWWLEFNRG